jgi:phospholipid/cholesterol/gamma-HCH transport system permease protein
VQFLVSMGRFGLYASQVLWRMVTPPFEVRETIRHTVLITVRCVVPVAAVVFPLGMVLALQGAMILRLFGAPQLLPSLIAVAVFREISPVLATALVTAQGGSAFAAELGAMRIQEELDATEVMAVDPLRVHVAPRVWATLFATPFLGLLGTLAGFAGGWFTACVVKDLPSGIYWANLWNLTGPRDLWGSLVKTVIFGLLIGLVATWRGFYAEGGEEGVGRAVNDTTVIAITAFVVLNYFLTSALFGSVA